MHPTTASYIAKSFAHDREVEAARDRRLAEFHRGTAASPRSGEPILRPQPDAGRGALIGGAAHAFAALLRRHADARA